MRDCKFFVSHVSRLVLYGSLVLAAGLCQSIIRTILQVVPCVMNNVVHWILKPSMDSQSVPEQKVAGHKR